MQVYNSERHIDMLHFAGLHQLDRWALHGHGHGHEHWHGQDMAMGMDMGLGGAMGGAMGTGNGPRPGHKHLLLPGTLKHLRK